MESIGETLRNRRTEQKLTLEEVSRSTRVKVDILERLEAEDYNALPSPTYTKGFLKIYAGFLGLNAERLAQAYLQSQGGLRRQGLQLETAASARARKPRELQLPLRGAVVAVLAISAGVLLIFLVQSWLQKRSASSEVAVAVPTSEPAGAFPKADFDAYYVPSSQPQAESLMPAAVQ